METTIARPKEELEQEREMLRKKRGVGKREGGTGRESALACLAL